MIQPLCLTGGIRKLLASSAHELLQLSQSWRWWHDVVRSLTRALGEVSGVSVCSLSRAQNTFFRGFVLKTTPDFSIRFAARALLCTPIT